MGLGELRRSTRSASATVVQEDDEDSEALNRSFVWQEL